MADRFFVLSRLPFMVYPIMQYTIMKKCSRLVLNMLLAAGLLLFLGGLTLLTIFFVAPQRHGFLLLPAVLLTVGVLLVYFSLIFKRRVHQLFLGMNFCFGGFMVLVLQRGDLPINLRSLWPCSAVFCGVSLLVSGFYRYRRMRTAYLFPACLLVFLGAFFCLFSFQIIRVSLRAFVSRWWPLALIALGGVLVGLFLYQQKNYFPYMTDESVNDTDGADEIFDEVTGEDK